MNRKARRQLAAKGHPPPSTPRAPVIPAAVLTASAKKTSRPVSPGPAPAPPKKAVARDPIVVPPGSLRSIVPGIEWPAVLLGHSANALTLQFQLQQTQWWSPERLRAHQFAQLALLVRHAGDTVPFYRDLFRRIGFDHRAPLSEESWAQLPMLNRADLQESFNALLSERIPKSHGELFECGSSGSTAAPVKVVKTALQQLLWEAGSLRDHLWQRRDLSGRMAAIRNPHNIDDAPYPDGIARPSWGRTTVAFESGPAHMLALATSVDLQVEWLNRIKPSCVLSYPSNLEALAHYCLDHGKGLPTVREFRSVSEVLRSEVRDICWRAFNCRVTDIYSAEEVGYVALQSPDSEELLIQAETILVEVVDDAGWPCSPGQVGRLAVTPLHAFGMPLLRYTIGDLGVLGGPASCGRGLPVLKEVLGRERHTIQLPDGRRLHPNVRQFYAGFAKIRQFQIVRKSATLLELRLVVRERLDEDEEQRMRARVHERFLYPFDVNITYHDVIPREPSGKYFDFKSEVG